MVRPLAIALLLCFAGCGDDEQIPSYDARTTLDAPDVVVDASGDAQAPAPDAPLGLDASANCFPSGGCQSGTPCGGGCCGLGERCVGDECRCGDGAACGVGLMCASGAQPKDGCGGVCCGGNIPCPP